MFALAGGGVGRGVEGKESHEAPALGTECPSLTANWPWEPSPCLVIRCLEGGVLQLSTPSVSSRGAGGGAGGRGRLWLPVD